MNLGMFLRLEGINNMLTITRTAPNMIEVKEDILSFYKTKTTYWYVDTKKWMESSHGRKNDVPDRVMTKEQVAWVKKYYIPKIKKVLDNECR